MTDRAFSRTHYEHASDCACTRCEMKRNAKSGLTAKSPRLTARVSEAEAKAAREAAEKAGVSVSEWLRGLIQNNA